MRKLLAEGVVVLAIGFTKGDEGKGDLGPQGRPGADWVRQEQERRVRAVLREAIWSSSLAQVVGRFWRNSHRQLSLRTLVLERKPVDSEWEDSAPSSTSC